MINHVVQCYLTATLPVQARLHGRRDLRAVIDRTSAIRPSDLLVFCTMRNEMLRVPWFLSYYRDLGVDHFLFVDNDSDDGLIDYLKQQPDCSVWHTGASYRGSIFGIHWINCLLARHGVGHWCLTVDPDEFLVYPHCEERSLRELVDHLDDADLGHMFCLMLDMYSDRAIRDTVYEAGADPLDVAPWFDATGYVQKTGFYDEMRVVGGPRRRKFFKTRPEEGPILNKTPLVRWKRHFSYYSSTHVAVPYRLNRPHPPDRFSPSGCLLHFKFLSVLAEKVNEAIKGRQYYNDSIEYRHYRWVMETGQDNLFHPDSVRFQDADQLRRLGLMSFGNWF